METDDYQTSRQISVLISASKKKRVAKYKTVGILENYCCFVT